MWQDIAPVPHTPPAPPAPAEARPIHEQLDSMLLLIDAMIKRVMPTKGVIPKDIPVREGKETVTALTSMMATVMRHREQLQEQEHIDIFRAAVTTVLKEMDAELQTRFMGRLEEELLRLQGQSRLATKAG